MSLQIQKIRMSHGKWFRPSNLAATVSTKVLDVETMHILVQFSEVPEIAAKGVAAQDVVAQDVAGPCREATSLSVMGAANLGTVLPVDEGLDKMLVFSDRNTPEILQVLSLAVVLV